MSVGRSTGTAVTGSEDSRDARIHVDFVGGEEYAVRMRGHHVATDQPLDNGGVDRGPSPVELFVASMAACTAYYAGRYLDRHHVHREGLRVSADYRMAADRPARVERVRLDVRVPDGTPANLRQGLHAVVSHCTVHNTLRQRPEIHIDIS
ncbi:OsmC family protein [Umezawaea sp.]|uniref:OsmC family protein n=1 Tax=Umezawaea sp. TaxID=1955258 RepID=UPI002ED1F0E4